MTGGPAGEQGYFAAANPYMSRISVKEFLRVNSGAVESAGFYDGNTITSATLSGGSLVTTGTDTVVKPMQGFFVKAKDASATTLDVKFTGTMMSPEVAEQKAETETAAEAAPAPQLRLTVRRGETRATTVLLTEGEAKAATIIDDEVSPRVAVFTVADGRAYDIHPAGGRKSIAVGIMTEGADTLTLSLSAEGGAATADYELYDNATGTAYPLDRELTFSGMGTSIGRFELRLRGTDDDNAGTARTLYVVAQNGRAIIRSAQPDIVRAESYAANGSKTDEFSAAGAPEAAVAVGRGLSVVRVTLADGSVQTFKILY